MATTAGNSRRSFTGQAPPRVVHMPTTECLLMPQAENTGNWYAGDACTGTSSQGNQSR